MLCARVACPHPPPPPQRILDWSLNAHSDDVSALTSKLTDDELDLFRAGWTSAHDTRRWRLRKTKLTDAAASAAKSKKQRR